ncbi:hypothetical protein FCL40_13605 [Ferrimonas sediminicola]|uniref:Uncharacterized protein n=1 Tax=Ferrimonas sediminicola TaxID=2569538 RepID=A0A4U1BC03_9GAMM|nr:hypothetical protein [Ferrimonas sediminicola]TKB48160.1 hypothetical protein FCL40_13605 [Ferrimonas sediminicola]
MSDFLAHWPLGYVEHHRADEPGLITEASCHFLFVDGDFLGDESDDGELGLMLRRVPVEALFLLTETDEESEGCIRAALGDTPVYKLKSQIQLHAVLNLLAHVSCGFSLSCVDWADVRRCLDQGELFEQRAETGFPYDSVPLAVYKAVCDLEQRAHDQGGQIGALVLTLLGGGDISMEHFGAASRMLQGLDGDPVVMVQTNLNEGATPGYHLFATLTPAWSQTREGLDLPSFLS